MSEKVGGVDHRRTAPDNLAVLISETFNFTAKMNYVADVFGDVTLLCACGQDFGVTGK